MQFVDLVSVASATNGITSNYMPASGSGTPTVSGGGQLIASIELIGTYSVGDFHVTSGTQN